MSCTRSMGRAERSKRASNRSKSKSTSSSRGAGGSQIRSRSRRTHRCLKSGLSSVGNLSHTARGTTARHAPAKPVSPRPNSRFSHLVGGGIFNTLTIILTQPSFLKHLA